MTTHIPADLRHEVTHRANGRCEYCQIRESDTFLGFQIDHIDHIVAEKHGGETTASNLAYCCVFCNRFKGTDLGSLAASGEVIRFFNPRTDDWHDHFQWDGHRISPQTQIAEVEERIFKLNSFERVLERQAIDRSG